ncbi:hypothetical protein [Actinoplanes sp. NPDC051411]|uniref:hypothetical protein n=1 Tax=Actinoplanes sp. NPDC051411 TaxID=3155522 RepID=UPI003439E301
MNRPILIPGLPRFWRGPREIQFGSDPSRALSIELPDPRAAQILDLLDGTRPERAVLLRAAELGAPVDQAKALLEALQAAGLVLPAADLLPTAVPDEPRRRLIGEAAALAMTGRHPADILRRRSNCRVILTGPGRLGAPIGVALTEAGVGSVQADVPGTVGPGELAGGPLHGTDLGRPRREAISDAVLRAASGSCPPSVRRITAPRSRPPSVRDPADRPPSAQDNAMPRLHPAFPPATDGTGPHPPPEFDPAMSLVVRLDQDGPPGVPHLAVTIRDGTPVIGPFVPAFGGPCLRCLDLHRQDRDPAWPSPPRRPLHEAIQPCAVATLLAATAFATAEALTHLDGGRPQTVGATVEITAPGRTRRRRWTPHPACHCTADPPARH